MKVIKIAAGVVIGAAAAALLIGCVLFFAREPLSTGLPDNGGADWMSGLSDDVLLSAVTLPGAHDSCAWNSDFSYFSQCQSADTKTQLEMGIRYLDIRISPDSGNSSLMMTHSVAVCREGGNPLGTVLTLEKVLRDCGDFLAQHPSETIVFCVKPEKDQETCLKLLRNTLRERPELWYTENRLPELGEVRGKLVLASRFGSGTQAPGIGLRWKEQDQTEIVENPFAATDLPGGGRLYVQDRYCYEARDKWTAFCYFMDGLADETDWERDIVLNFLSTKGPRSLGHPLRYARLLNRSLLDLRLGKGSFGWIIVDFAQPELVRQIYETNLPQASE